MLALDESDELEIIFPQLRTPSLVRLGGLLHQGGAVLGMEPPLGVIYCGEP